ncbi:MAG: hypothetical protein ACRDNF_03615 [Streptosporangiaceae bacterium]
MDDEGSPARGTSALGVPVGEDAPDRARRWLHDVPRPVFVHAAVLAAYLIADFIVNWSRALYLFQHVVPKNRDAGLYIWDFWWMARSVTHLSDPYFSRYQAAPIGVPLAYHTLMPLPGALMTPVTLAFGPAFSFNLLTVLAPGLTCYAMYRVARLWLPTQTGAIAAGGLFGLSTIMTWDAWYTTQLAVGGILIPVVLECAVRLGRRPGWPRAAALGVVLGVLVLIDQETAILAGLVGAAALLPWLARLPSRGGDPVAVKLRSVVFAVAAFAVVGSPQFIATYQQGKAGDAAVSQAALAGDYRAYAATLQQMFAPSPRVAAFGLVKLHNYYYGSGPVSLTMVCYGWVLCALALLGIVVFWRRHGTKPLALLWIASAILALGTVIGINRHTTFIPFAQTWHGVRVSLIMPFTWLVRISALSSFREPDRLTELGLVPAALLAAAGVDWLRRRLTPALVVVFLLAILEMGSVDAGTSPAISMPISLPGLDGPIAADHSRSIVVDVPFGVRSAVPLPGQGAAFDPEAQVQATADGHPRVVAYTSRLPARILAEVLAHPFYGDLMEAQNHQDILYRELLTSAKGDAARLAAARLDASRMDVGWAIVWHQTPVIVHYLQAVGFRFDYRADGALVFRR